MTSPESTARLVRFGLFELDAKTGELRRKGAKVALQDQPFQVLAMLLARPGELVTRDELRQKLWADAVFVDFDHGLNKAVGKIRRALGDLAESPRFVETLERRGYRFIAPVERVPAIPPAVPDPTAPALVVRLVWNDRAIPLAHGTHFIGRDPASAIWIDSSVVSRRHARLMIDDAAITLEDLGSRNGTFVNDDRIDDVRRLVDGDEIRVGPARLILHAARSAATLTDRSER
jgi:DNA-binding winged helix-turn-helix (wHTH) protein